MNDLFFRISKIFSNKLIIIFENLDRCKPEFAREVIEIAKHIFNNENITLLLVGDWNKINSNIIGYKQFNDDNTRFDEYYLSKIIDFKFTLNKLSTNDYLFRKFILNKTKNANLFYLNTNKNAISIERAEMNFNYLQDVIKNYTIREQEKIIMNFANTIKIREFYQQSRAHSIELDHFLLCNNLGVKLTDNIFYKFFIDKLHIQDNCTKFYIMCAILNLLSQVRDINDDKFFKNFIDVKKYSELRMNIDINSAISTFENMNFCIDSYLKEFNMKNSGFIETKTKILYDILLADKILKFFEDWFKNNLNIF